MPRSRERSRPLECRAGVRRALGCLALLAAAQVAQPAEAQRVIFSPDITLDLRGLTVPDEAVVDFDSGSAEPIEFADLPLELAVTAFEIAESGPVAFAVDASVRLGDIEVTPQDIVLSDNGSFDFLFKGRGNGIPRGARIDAVTLIDDECAFSLDITVQLDGLIAADEDLILCEGGLLFDGSESGIARELDLDAAHLNDDGDLLVSFDGTGEVTGITFHDEDVLLFDGGGWELLVRGRDLDSELRGGDLEALSIVEVVPPLFADNFESGGTGAWSLTVP
ncbi:MAG: hypothetical protein AAF725_13200 [Acidobacteriota bacterium]